ncbi:MAG TPA: hypothetical protein PLU66_02905 [Trueperaceae bacterium]|nr:hypothetical protein [Trueperaceae bacterium]
MQRSIDLTLSVLASVLGFGLSWPYWRSFSYFAESHTAWWIYFALGFVLAVFVFYVFFRALRTIFMHGHGHDGHGDHSHDGHSHDADPLGLSDTEAHAQGHERHSHDQHKHPIGPPIGTPSQEHN